MRELGTPVYSRKFFAAILEHFPQESFVCRVRHGEQIVAAGFLTGYRGTMEANWSAASPKAMNLRPNMFLFWQMLCFAGRRGYRIFDFGRSSVELWHIRFQATVEHTSGSAILELLDFRRRNGSAIEPGQPPLSCRDLGLATPADRHYQVDWTANCTLPAMSFIQSPRTDQSKNIDRTNTPQSLTVSVIIPTKNRSADLARTIDTLLQQTVQPLELIIVDQSAQPTFTRKIKIPTVCIHEPTLSGLTAARNTSMRVARGDIWLFLDDDVLLEPDFIEKILAAYDANVTGVSGIITNYSNPALRQRLLGSHFPSGSLSR